MKKVIGLLLALTFTFSLGGCSPESSEGSGNSQGQETSATEEPGPSAGNAAEETTPPQQDGESNILIAYFSWADNAVIDGEVDVVASPSVTSPGNVQQLAGWVQEETGGALFSIQVTEPYSSDWDECLERANGERAENARPELTASVENMESYDTIFLGYPNWWYGAPMAVLSFLEDYDFSGKQVYLFCSHGTGGLANSVEDIRASMPGANISENIFDVYEENAASSQEDIQSWLTELGY